MLDNGKKHENSLPFCKILVLLQHETNKIIYKIMSKKNKINSKREAYKAKQEKKLEEQGKSVIRWIAITLIVLCLGLIGYFATLG